MEELSSPKFLHIRQSYGYRVAPFKSNRRHLLPVQCYDVKHHDWGWMLNWWHSAVFRDIIHKCYDTIILFVKGRNNGKSFLIKKIEDSIHVILQTTQQTVLKYCCTQQKFPATFQTFSSHLFEHPGYSGDWNVLMYQSCCFLAWVVIECLFLYFLT